MSSRAQLPINLELVIYTGTTFHRELKWLPQDGTPQDFTGWSATLLIGPRQGTAVAELSTANGGVTLTSLGQIVLRMPPAKTELLKSGDMYYHMDLTDPTGFVLRFLRGRVSVVSDVKKP